MNVSAGTGVPIVRVERSLDPASQGVPRPEVDPPALKVPAKLTCFGLGAADMPLLERRRTARLLTLCASEP